MTLANARASLCLLRGALHRHLRTAMLAVLFAITWSHAAVAACPSCGASPCTITGTYTIGSGVTCNYAGKDVILTGTLQGDGNADCYTVVANSLTVRGTLRARRSCVQVEVTGAFNMEIVSGSAATVDVRDADSSGDGLWVTSCGSAALNGNAVNADGDGTTTMSDFSAGFIVIECSGDVTGNGASFHATGIGNDRGGWISIASSDGSINLGSAFDASSVNDIAGIIDIDAADDVTVGTASRSLQAQAGPESSGGDVTISGGGTVTVNGVINVNGNGTASDGGTIGVQGADIVTGTTWWAHGDGGGSGGSIDVRTLTGVGTGTVTTTTGNASWNVTGGNEASGGSIYIGADGDVALAGDMDAGTNGADSWGGDIWIETAGDITIASTSRIESDATGTDASDGTIYLGACNITIAGDLDTRNLEWGHNDFSYAGTLTQNAGSSLLADTSPGFSSGNNFSCRCVDTSPADGTCDSPLACANPPTLNGTVTPAAALQPISRATCS